MVEPASPTAGIDIRRDYAVIRCRLCRHRPRDRARRVTAIVATIVAWMRLCVLKTSNVETLIRTMSHDNPLWERHGFMASS
jgi:hypothetical protein